MIKVNLSHSFRTDFARKLLAVTGTFFLMLLSGLSIASAETVTIPGYAPELGVEHTYRSKKSGLTDMSMWFDNPAAAGQTNYGDFRQRVTITKNSTDSFLQQWKLSADLPPDASGPLEMNNMFRNTLAAYGVEQLGIETDLNGSPIDLLDKDRIIANVKTVAASGAAGSETSGLDAIVQMLEQNPLAVIEAIVPEAAYLSTPQSHESGTYEIGQSWELEQEESVNGFIVPVTSTWKVEATDPVRQTATMSWKQISDPVALAKTQEVTVTKLMASFSERVKTLTSEQLTYMRSASKTRDGNAVISLRDGTAIELNEVLTVISGGVKMVSTVHIMRED
ncbi:hypothetical protein [Phyllobacterium sp. SB3]|uniref:hypothetical protein n=1 Tax=Phyllobacterium sp. SB3 TaxID=3156073 RepID=UPI0032AF9D8F